MCAAKRRHLELWLGWRSWIQFGPSFRSVKHLDSLKFESNKSVISSHFTHSTPFPHVSWSWHLWLEWNVLTAIGWTAVKSGRAANTSISHRLDCKQSIYCNPFTINREPLPGQNFSFVPFFDFWPKAKFIRFTSASALLQVYHQLEIISMLSD